MEDEHMLVKAMLPDLDNGCWVREAMQLLQTSGGHVKDHSLLLEGKSLPGAIGSL